MSVNCHGIMLSVILLFLIAGLLIFKYYTRNKNYWKKKGVFQVDIATFQSIKKNCIIGELYKDIFDKHREEPYFGIFLGSNPALLLRDLRDIQAVLDTNFHCFYDHGTVTNAGDVLTDDIFFINDYRRWKLIRQKLVPTFTNVKMRDMFQYVDKRVHDFINNMHGNKSIKENPFKALNAFSASVVGASLFGLDDISHNSDDSSINNMMWDILSTSFVKNIMLYAPPTYTNYHRYSEYFVNITKRVLKSRRRETIIRQDLISTALELQKSGVMTDSDEILAAQAYFFLLGGVNHPSVVTHFTFLELASNKNILERLHEEIDSVFKKCNEKITFDDMGKFVYLDMILCEVLRKYPPIQTIKRNCTADTTLPSTQKKVTKGTTIIIPVYALHRDKTYFLNPAKFDPERFSNENRPKIFKFSYLPFGEGNRRCIGMKYASLLLKFCIAWILRSFTLKEQKYDPKTFDPNSDLLRDASARFELIPRK